MTKFDERTVANMEVALEEAFAGMIHGGDHESRKHVAKRLIQGARRGSVTLEALRAVAREAFDQLSARRPNINSVSSQSRRSSNRARSTRCTTANTMAVETPNIRAPLVASIAPSRRQAGVISKSP